MGTTMEFTTASGDTTTGYVADGTAGRPGVLVIQEWWGLVPQIEATCDRFASAGFTALAPDLYGGVQVPLDEPDSAAKEMMGLELPYAAADLATAVDALVERTGCPKVGVIGYCMGGGLALMLAADRPEEVGVVIPCYGVHPWPEGKPHYGEIKAAAQIHCAGLDDYFTPEAAEELATTLTQHGREVELYVYDGAHHAFANEDRPEVYDADAATTMFTRSVDFLASHLG